MSSTSFLLLVIRAKTNNKSDNRFRYTPEILLISSLRDNATRYVSARLDMVRDKCKIDDVRIPPGSMKLVKSANSDSNLSIFSLF